MESLYSSSSSSSELANNNTREPSRISSVYGSMATHLALERSSANLFLP